MSSSAARAPTEVVQIPSRVALWRKTTRQPGTRGGTSTWRSTTSHCVFGVSRDMGRGEVGGVHNVELSVASVNAKVVRVRGVSGTRWEPRRRHRQTKAPTVRTLADCACRDNAAERWRRSGGAGSRRETLAGQSSDRPPRKDGLSSRVARLQDLEKNGRMHALRVENCPITGQRTSLGRPKEMLMIFRATCWVLECTSQSDGCHQQ